MINPNSQVETICAEFDWVGWGNKFCLQLKTKNKNLSTHSSFFQLQFKWKLKASTHCISRSSGSLALKVLCKRCEIEWSVLHCRTKIEVKWRYTNRYPQIKTRTGLEALTCRWGEALLLGQLRSQVRTITSSNHLLPASRQLRQPLHHTCTQPGPGSSAPLLLSPGTRDSCLARAQWHQIGANAVTDSSN